MGDIGTWWRMRHAQCESCINVGAPNDPVGFFSTWLLPCWQSTGANWTCSVGLLS